MSGPKLFTIRAGADFARSLAKGLIARVGSGPLSLSRTTIFLPTRRAARGFGEAFAAVLGGSALLPQFRALGDTDADELSFDAVTEDALLPPAISPIRRQLVLAAMIRRWDQRARDGTLNFAQALGLADSLASLLDETERQGADLARLKGLAPVEMAVHWQDVVGFLDLIQGEWPDFLKAEGLANPAARRNAALALVTERLRRNPPEGMVIAAGSTGSIPATARLIAAIAELPDGAVVLPGLDRSLDEKSWNDLDPGHPQFGMKQLLEQIGAERESVADWDGSDRNAERENLLRESLRPAPTTDAWRAIAERGGKDLARGLNGLSLIEANDPAEEARVIALALRHSLETAGRNAALVTPDRNLARRVAAELARWEVAIDDSAGRPLAHASAGVFLLLVAEAAEAGFAPVPLLALLKHPFTTLGGEPAPFRAMTRLLDQYVLRGSRPDPGLDGIAKAIATARSDRRKPAGRLADLAAWWEGIAKILTPLEAAFAQAEIALADLVSRHIAAAEKLSCGDGEPCPLWRGADGEAAAELFSTLPDAAAGLPPVEAGSYPSLLRTLMMQAAVRPPVSNRAIAILGPLEARLQRFDLTILAGLNEGNWPSAVPPDPWFSRPMRRALGLEQPERRIGLAAHDFASLAAGPEVLLTHALKADGAPTIASRWLQRLKQLTKGLGLEPALNPPLDYLGMARALSEAPRRTPTIPRPAPTPPVAARPRRLSVTEIETWLRDPYAIYARHVLKLQPLDALDEDVGPLERGTAFHRILELFVGRYPGALPPDALLKLDAVAEEVFAGTPAAQRAIWRPRFLSAAQWFVENERARRPDIAKSHLEVAGRISFAAPYGPFLLTGKADRIDILKDGSAAILDYKTGGLPDKKWMVSFLTPQLPLEGAMLAEGGFAGLPVLAARDLIYLRLCGGAKGGEERVFDGGMALEAAARLAQRIAWFDQKTTPYHSRVAPQSAKAAGDYDHLARVREWAPAGWTEEP